MGWGAEAAAWMAAIVSGAALVAQAWNAWKKRKQDKSEIDEALAREPIVRQQLELGNVGEAVRHLNAIIASQDRHIKAQDTRIDNLEADNARLSARNEALEAEAEGWEHRYSELMATYEELKNSMNQRLLEMKQQHDTSIKNLEKTYARSLALLREQIEQLREAR